MMKNILIILMLSVAMTACTQNIGGNDEAGQDEAFKRDYHELVGEMKKMVEKDQALRLYYTYGTTDPLLIDSIKNVQREAGINVDSFDLAGSYLAAAQIDSTERQFDKQDSIHTKRMVEIMSIYGYPSPKIRMNDINANVDPFIILHHPHLYFKDTLLTLLTKEVKLKRVDSNTYNMLVWDLNGRNGVPPGTAGITIMKMNKDGSVDTVSK